MHNVVVYEPLNATFLFIRNVVTFQQMLSVGKDDSNRYTGEKISISRCSSRSFHDDFDELEFSCPFDVDDDDIIDPGSR